MGLIQKQFGQRVRQLRKQWKLSQEELAEKAGLHATYVGAVERGERNLSLGSMEKIAKGLGVELKDLFVLPKRGRIGESEKLRAGIADRLKKEKARNLRLIRAVVETLLSNLPKS